MLLVANDEPTNLNLGNFNAINDNSPLMTQNRRELPSNLSPISYPFNYDGSFITIVDFIDPSMNLGKLHPIKNGKLFFKIFIVIETISSVGSRIKIVFNSVTNTNLFMSSLLVENGLKSQYSYYVIILSLCDQTRYFHL